MMIKDIIKIETPKEQEIFIDIDIMTEEACRKIKKQMEQKGHILVSEIRDIINQEFGLGTKNWWISDLDKNGNIIELQVMNFEDFIKKQDRCEKISIEDLVTQYVNFDTDYNRYGMHHLDEVVSAIDHILKTPLCQFIDFSGYRSMKDIHELITDTMYAAEELEEEE